MNSDLLMSYLLLYILNIITCRKKKSTSEVSLLFFITPSGEFLLDESTMPKPTSAFPEHSVEAVWEAEMPSKIEPLNTACAPGIPKCLPPPRPMLFAVGKSYVYWLIPERFSECMLIADSVPVSEDMERKGYFLPEFLYRMYRRRSANCFPAH